MNPVAIILRAVQIVRSWGVTITFEDGWETRGNGYRSAWLGVLVHHTGTPSSARVPFPTRRLLREGRTDLRGPLCNSAGPADGSVHIMAAQAANHAGASGGKSMGPLPVRSLFNPLVFGHEIDYAGSSPMLAAQYRTAVLWSRALLIALHEARQIPAFDVERVRLHAETSITGKWDAGYKPGVPIDGAGLRRAIATPPEEDMPLTKKDAQLVADTLLTTMIHNHYLGRSEHVRTVIGALQDRVVRQHLEPMRATVAAAIADPDIDSAEVGRLIDESVRRHTPTAEDMRAVMMPLVEDVARRVAGQDNEALVDELLRELGLAITEGAQV